VPAAVRTLTQRQLLLALLDRQLLLARARLPIPKALERMGGLQAQYAPSMYIGLWTRLEHFERADLDAALARRTVVQGTLLRSTIHLVSAADYWPFAAGIRESRKKWWLQIRHETDAGAMDAAVVSLRRHLRAADGPQRAKDIEQAVGTPIMAFNQWTELVRVPPSGTWDRRRADLYAMAEDWIAPPERVTVDDATEHLVRRYLGAFGPATAADIANWAGLPPRQVLAALDRMRPRLRPFRSQAGDDLVDLPRAPLPDPDTPVPVRFLPVWDATLLVHARRTGILPEEHRTRLFNSKNPQSFHTFLVDGTVAGTWKHTPSGVELSPFTTLPTTTRSALEEEAQGLDALHR
jgi:winged helix DNA-binding protein